MDKEYDIFTKALKIGEKLFDIHYTDYLDAYNHCLEHFVELAEHQMFYFRNYSNMEPAEYKYDLIRYVFIKAIESRITSDIYANTEAADLCDTYYSPFDIFLPEYPTNLPKQIEAIVNFFQENAKSYASAIKEKEQSDSSFEFCNSVLYAASFLGHTLGHPYGKKYTQFESYLTRTLLTRNEMNELACTNLCIWLDEEGYEVMETSCSREPVLSVLAQKNGVKYMIIYSAEIYPVSPGFLEMDVKNLIALASEKQAVPMFATIILASENEEHFNDGVIVTEDKTKFMISAFDRINEEEFE